MSVVREMMSEPLSQTQFVDDTFQYQPMPPLVPISMAFVCLSLLAGLSDLLLIIPMVGIVLSFIGYYQISRSRGELSGGVLALSSLVLMLLIFIAFASLHLHSYATEVPVGYSRVNFNQDISQKGFPTENGQPGIHPDVAKLADQPIYLKGYMFPFRETKGLKSFVLCKDSGDCCFGGQPKPTDMILINMMDGQTVDYHEKQLVGVAGTLKIEPTYDESGLNPVYQLDCQHFAPAKTWY
ncbi:DUF3299 domain-containing protein [Schlesneria sp.]|uniref:DUF3299 domain-containing protein n=1 Tax=Schlesneria sp. TaxID=2762018 RepID=UPI002F154C0A